MTDGEFSKSGLLLRVLRENPREAWDRLVTFADFQFDRLRRGASNVPGSSIDFEKNISQALGGDVQTILRESELSTVEELVSHGLEQLGADATIPAYHAAAFTLARLCYAVCRMQRPKVVVETGVAHGVTSAFLLQALEVNGAGELWSIDLPPLAEGADHQVGHLIPVNLRSRWHLLRGSTRRALPRLVVQLPTIDLFIHDSLHTYRNMSREFQTIWPKLRAGGVLLSDDVELNRAFERFAGRHPAALHLTSGQEDKSSVLGAIVKPGGGLK
jgi:predicted O-methyltransferase YrrM